MYNQFLINAYINYVNKILDTAEEIEETKNGYMLARLLSDIGFTQSLITNHRLSGSKYGYSEEFIKDLESFEYFLSSFTWKLADFITVR